jgi:pyridoxal phosphate enzyme (YggS family)
VTIVAVSKTAGRAEVDGAYRAGVRDFGENRVQAAAEKFASPMPPDARLHMIGHLQSNKAGVALEIFSLIHSVDRQSLIRALQKHAITREAPVDVLLQVNVAGESQKSGCDPSEVRELARQIARANELNLLGLMTMAPLVEDAELVRSVFRQLAQTRMQLSAESSIGSLPILSMGMTNDFEVAIEEGATHVRIGRAIFAPDS